MAEILDYRNYILEYQDIKSDIVEIPEWGGIKLLVKEMSGGQRATFAETAVKADGKVDIAKAYSIIVTNVFHPETGAQIFDPADRDIILTKNGNALDKIMQKIIDLSGLNKGAVEEAVGN